MKIDLKLKKPCGNCPFLKEGAIELRAGRVESICKGLLKNDRSIFMCHKTLERETRSACMGALAWQHKAGRLPVSVRFALMAGMLKEETLTRLNNRVIDYKPRG